MSSQIEKVVDDGKLMSPSYTVHYKVSHAVPEDNKAHSCFIIMAETVSERFLYM